MKVTVLGSGAWGTALAMVLLENGNDVTIQELMQDPGLIGVLQIVGT